MASDADVLSQLRAEAEKLTEAWLDQYKPRIAKLPESERQAFDEVKHQVKKPVVDSLDLDSRLTLDWSSKPDAPRWAKHLYQDEKGMVAESLDSSWETAVLKEEMSAEGFVGWLRNRERQPWALSIPYESGGIWKPCFPDFIVFRSVDGHIVTDIVDPHLISLEDAPKKAAALAKYADDHQDRLGRVDLIIVEKQGGAERVKRLRLLDSAVRKKVMGVTTNQHLRDLFDFNN